MSKQDRVGAQMGVTPVLLSEENVREATGLTWREALAFARGLGVAVVQVGPRRVISARQLLAAIEARGCPQSAEVNPEESAEQVVLARLGRGGGK